MSKLFSNFEIKDLKLKNRIVMAPMCQYSADNKGYMNNWHLIHYSTRAVGGVGLIMLEATAVEARGRISDRDLGIWDDNHIDGLSKIIEQCHSNGAKVGIQLAHAGRKCSIASEEIVAPSSIAFSLDYQTPKELSKEDIQKIVEAFGQGARRAFEAGFDLIEIHGAHGYLINEFLSPLTNKRTDEYGGSKKNRARFLKEVLSRVKDEWPEDKPITLRVSAEDYEPSGNHPAILAELINIFKDDGIDIINVSSGGVLPIGVDDFPGYQVTFSEIIRSDSNIPTIAGGIITSPLMAEEILRNNRADLIFLGRELLRNPYWSLQAASELRDNIEWPHQYERSKK
jgi:NADPH2 dehydrogenase